MSRRRGTAFTAVRSAGGLLPEDFFQRLAAGDKRIEGTGPETYHLAKHERIGEIVNRSWSRLLGAWRSCRDALGELPDGDPAVSLTRERWLLPLFQELGYGRLVAAKAVEIDGKQYPISHFWQGCPIHLLGAGVPLDRRSAGVAGAAHSSPHGLVQGFLNRSRDHVWGFLSNGLALRVLRDTHSLTRQAFVEFDLEAIMEGEQYSEFLLLWLVCHESRVEPQEPGKPETCWLERWFQANREEGVRALDRLRDGVEQSIQLLGRGFLRHPENARLHERLKSGALEVQDYYRQLLRLVYRLIFLFVTEDRELLLDPSAPKDAKERYLRFYSTARIRHLAERRRGTAHGDLWRALRLVMNQLEQGYTALALPALDSFLWREEAVADLLPCELVNEDLLAAVRSLCRVTDGRIERQVSFKDLGAEELGSIYEALLELQPRVHRETGTFELGVAAGHERKTTGSYYTPTSLVECLLDTALDPVLNEAAAKPHQEAAILDLKVCDPACGSGHFLLAAARRIARRLASLRTGDEEPSPEAMRTALRDVVGHCLYGVDINPMAVELCKVSLWMEALEPGKPLSFLDAHIQCGNALLGTTPALMVRGIPTEAFQELTGDDKEVAARLRKRNREARQGQDSLLPLLAADRTPADDLPEQALQIEQASDETIKDLHKKEQSWANLVQSYAYRDALFWANVWCAAFLWPKQPGDLENGAPTHDLWLRMQKDSSAVPQVTRAQVNKLAKEYALFHWHLALPAVFKPLPPSEIDAETVTGWEDGFDVVLGNPPWDQIELQERQWFATRDPDIANAPNADKRKRLVQRLKESDRNLYEAYESDLRHVEATNALLRDGGRYPLTAHGRLNMYPLFAELNRTLLAPAGRVGCIVPAGIATDDNNKLFFQDLLERHSLVSLYHFENEERVFPAVHHAQRFCLLTMTGPDRPVHEAELVGYARQVSAVTDQARRYTLGATDFALMNPNTRTLPVFRRRRDAEITKSIYQRVPVLVREGDVHGNPWGVSFRQGIFNMASDSALFRTREELERQRFRLAGNVFVKGNERFLPLYEAKMVHNFDHRFGTYEGQTEAQARQGKLPESTPAQHDDPDFVVLPRYWAAEREIEERLADRWNRWWLLGWRDICRTSDARTVIAAVMPRVGVGHTMPLIFADQQRARSIGSLITNLASFTLDYVARQKIGGTHLTFGLFNQLPILSPDAFDGRAPWDRAKSVGDWLKPRVLELSCAAWDVAPFARDLGWDGPPFQWDEQRRFLLRCELDAAFFHLYGVQRDDVEYILDSFWVVRERDEKAYGTYRTKEAILDLYDRLQRAIETGRPYATVLDPPPADPRVAHPARKVKVIPFALSDLAELPDGAWARPNVDPRGETGAILAAVLKAVGAATPAHQVRLVAILALEPRLLVPSLDPDEAAAWRRLVGGDADPLPAGIMPFVPTADHAWGWAVRYLRGHGMLVEDMTTNMWAPGPGLDAIQTDGWPDGRARMVLGVLRRRSTSEVVQQLPEAVQRWVDAAAA